MDHLCGVQPEVRAGTAEITTRRCQNRQTRLILTEPAVIAPVPYLHSGRRVAQRPAQRLKPASSADSLADLPETGSPSGPISPRKTMIRLSVEFRIPADLRVLGGSSPL